MRWFDCRVVAFDTETTGLNAAGGDRVIEFGAVELVADDHGRVAEVRRHDFLVNPERPIPSTASRVSGITDEMVADAPTFAEVGGRVRELLEDAVVVAHNLAFDFQMVRAELERAGSAWPPTRAEVDTLPLAQRLLPGLESYRLGDLAKRLGVPLDEAHRAASDAEACGRVLFELARRHQAPEDLDAFVEWADAVGPPPDTGHVGIGPRGGPVYLDGPLAGEEVERHPDHLHWMVIALERRDGEWRHRYPESLRRWATRWLRARASGRARLGGRGGSGGRWIEPLPGELP